MALIQTLRSVHQRDVRIYLALLLDFIGFGLFISLLPILFGVGRHGICSHLDASMRYCLLGLFLGTFALCQAASNLIFSKKLNHGRWTHRFLRLAYLANCLSYLIAFFAVRASNLPLLFFSNVLSGLCNTNITASQILIGNKREENRLLGNYSLMLFVINTGLLISSFLATYVIHHAEFFAGVDLFLWIPSCCSLISFALIYFLRSEVKEGVELQKRFTFNLPFFLAALFFSCAWTLFIKFFQIHALEDLHFEKDFVAHFLRYLSLGAFLNLLILTRLRRQYVWVFFFGLALLGCSIFLALQQSRVEMLALLITCAALAYNLCHSLFPFLVRRHFPDGKHWLPLYYFSSGMGKVVAPFFAGVYALITFHFPFMISIALLIGSALLFSWMLGKQWEPLKQADR